MKCERCGRREAAVKYIEVEEGVKRTRWLCEVCAAEEGASEPVGGSSPADETGLPTFLGAASDPAAAAEDADLAPCPACGLRLNEFQDSGLLGCPRCYTHFRSHLVPMMRRFHRASTHLGKAPRARGPRAALRLEIGQLRSALEAAVAAEDFEEAARLRDEISRRQSALSGSTGADVEEDS